MKYAVFDMPLESIHGLAFGAAIATKCAADQGKYWEMRTRLWSNPQTLGDTVAHAKAVGLDQAKFSACVSDSKTSDGIRHDMEQAVAMGINGTPTFVLARLGANGELKIERMLQGAQPFAAFKAQLDALLAAQ